jgi:N-methylhydantoinase A/oxoprolinase/acetone carboxylase beta subunit
VAAAAAELARLALESLPGARLEFSYDLRYAGQAFELQVAGDAEPSLDQLRFGYDEAHSERYGYADERAELELVNVRVAALDPRPKPGLGERTEQAAERGRRPALFGGKWFETEVLRGEPTAGSSFDGPLIVERSEATIVVPPSWSATTDERGTVVLEPRR